MKVQLKNEMTLNTPSCSVKFAAKEAVTLSRTPANNLLIEDAQGNKVLVANEEIFKAVMENCTYGTTTKSRAKLPLRRVCEEADPELVADFIAATDQLPNEKAEKGAEDHLEDKEGGLDKLEIEVPVTMTKDTSVEDKIEVLTEEEEVQVVDADLADVEAQSAELVDDSPAFTKDQTEDVDVAETNDPDVKEPSEEPKGEGEEFFVDSEQMREEVELVISPEGEIRATSGSVEVPEEEFDMTEGEEEEVPVEVEPDMGAAGVEAPVVDMPPEEATDEPVITESDEKTCDCGEENCPICNPKKDDEKAVEDPTEDATKDAAK